jgi:hypothetical protein
MILKYISCYRKYTSVRLLMISAFLLGMASNAMAQEKWDEGEIEKVEIEIVKERQIVSAQSQQEF